MPTQHRTGRCVPILLIAWACHAHAQTAQFYRVNASTNTTITGLALAGSITWTNPGSTGTYAVEASTALGEHPPPAWDVVAYGNITAGTCTARLLMPATPDSPFGVCAHIARDQEHPTAREECAAMRDAGIRWVRTDFDWSYVQPQSNQWVFEQLDDTIREARMAGLTVLPILGYHVNWASPAWDHLPQWRAYVRALAERYANRIPCWEIWNEENLEYFWGATPNPTQYVDVLRAAYEEIKAVDPSLTVVLGGLSGIPHDFIRGVYGAGGSNCFDVMNVHPYRYPNSPERGDLVEDLQRLRALMAEHGDAGKPIWITEIGWPTHANYLAYPDGGLWRDCVREGLGVLDPTRSNWVLAVLDDPDYPVAVNVEDQTLSLFAPGTAVVQHVYLNDIASLCPTQTHALLMPPDEGFPVDYFNDIERYVRDGGALVLSYGVPLYYRLIRDSTGTWQRTAADETYRQRLHIGWEAWWFAPGVPEETPYVAVATAFVGRINPPSTNIATHRYLTAGALRAGDSMTPLLFGCTNGYTGIVAAAYNLNSGLTGGVVVCTFGTFGGLISGVGTNRQAELLPRAFALALQTNVDKVFWYEFQAFESDPFYNEAHFGIVHPNTQPKPAYAAYAALTRARPPGSTTVRGPWQTNGIYYPRWERPGGTNVWMLWHPGPTTNAQVQIGGGVVEAFDYVGNAVTVEVVSGAAQVELGERPLYIVGPTNLDF